MFVCLGESWFACLVYFIPVHSPLGIFLLPSLSASLSLCCAGGPRRRRRPRRESAGQAGHPHTAPSTLTARRAVRAAQTGAQRGPGCKQRPRRVARPQFFSLGLPAQRRRAGRACPKEEVGEGNGVGGVTRPVPASGMRPAGTPAGSGMQVQGGLCGMCQGPARASGSVVVCGWCWGIYVDNAFVCLCSRCI